MNDRLTILQGDALTILQTLPDCSVNCCVTSPPYWNLRDYQTDGQIGMEATPEEYVQHLVDVFCEVKRTLRDDGTLFLNLGDSYYGSWGNYGGQNRGNGTQRDIKRGSSVPNPAYNGLEGFRPPTAGVRHAAAYGTSGRVPEGFQDHDCLCGNLCDVCRVVYRNHKSRNDGLLVAMLTASLSCPNLEHTGFESDRVPTLDLPHLEAHTLDAIEDRQRFVALAGERLRVFLVSTIGGFSPQLLDVCLQRAALSVCLLCARSLVDSVRESVRMSGDLQGQCERIPDIVALDGLPRHRNQDINRACGCYEQNEPYLDYTTVSHLLKPKDLVGVPWLVAFALRADGWYLRSDIIWSKSNPMPESVTDRPTRAHEYLFLLSKSRKYYYDADTIKEPAIYFGLTGQDESGFKNAAEFNGKHGKAALSGKQRRDKQRGHSCRHAGFNDRWDAMERAEQCSGMRNKRSVWTVATHPYPEAHFATFPADLIRPCILAGCPAGGTVLDPFAGSGTTGQVALENGCKAILIELNPEYCKLIEKRCDTRQDSLFWTLSEV